MPQLQTHDSSDAPGAILALSAGYGEDADDIALGCECADPRLQIEVWGQEASAFADAH